MGAKSPAVAEIGGAGKAVVLADLSGGRVGCRTFSTAVALAPHAAGAGVVAAVDLRTAAAARAVADVGVGAEIAVVAGLRFGLWSPTVGCGIAPQALRALLGRSLIVALTVDQALVGLALVGAGIGVYGLMTSGRGQEAQPAPSSAIRVAPTVGVGHVGVVGGF